jgi:hypothetical protein
VNTAVDADNCGSCGVRCTGGTRCVMGGCKCPPGFELCGGVCVNTQQSGQNCGACNTACAGFQLCNGGRCVEAGGGRPDGGMGPPDMQQGMRP